MNKLSVSILIAVSLFFLSCQIGYKEGSAKSIALNPYSNAPLSATFNSSVDGTIKIEVEGKGSDGIAVSKTFENVKQGDTIPILGLYPDFENRVTIIEIPNKGKRKKVKTTIRTDSLDHYPDIRVDTFFKSKCSDLMTSFCHFRAKDRYCLIFDNMGEIRWYLEAEIKNMMFKRLKNGHIIFFDTSPDKNKFTIYNHVGQLIQSGSVQDYNGASFNTFHHDLYELENGHLIVPMQKVEQSGIKKPESILIEIDTDGNVYQEWDFDEIFLDILKEENDATPDNLNDTCFFVVPNEDWLHINSIEYQASDQSLILSSQRWFIFKIGLKDKLLKWIIGDETREWYTRFPSLRKYSMKNLNAGIFDPPRGQHAVRLMPNGNLLFFNNGYSDIYNGGPHESKAFDYTYSSASEYRLNEQELSYEQMWQYGKETGVDLYSFITSNVQLLDNENRFISFNSIRTPERNMYKPGKIIELNTKDEVVFSATITVDPAKFTYRNTRTSLYPN